MRVPAPKRHKGRSALPSGSPRGSWRKIEQMFPRALIACICEARPAKADEIALLGEKLWFEGLSRSDLCDRRTTDAMAKAALGGCRDSQKDEVPRSLAAIFRLWVARRQALPTEDVELEAQRYRLSVPQDQTGTSGAFEFRATETASVLSRAKRLLAHGRSASLLQNGRVVARLSHSREGFWTLSKHALVRS